MRIEVPPVGHSLRQDSTWRPALLVAHLICERNRLVLEVEALRVENARLRARSSDYKRRSHDFA